MRQFPRSNGSRPRRGLVGLTLLAVLATEPAIHAYIDPATGSIMLQLLVAGVAGSLYALKTFWGNIRSALPRFFSTLRAPPKK